MWLFTEQILRTSSKSTWPEKAKEATMEQMAWVDLPDRPGLSLLAKECTRLRKALIQPETVFLETSGVLFYW